MMSNESNSPVSMDDVARYFNAPAALAALTNAEMIAALSEVHFWARDLPIPTRGACSAMQKVCAVRDALAAAPVAAQAGQVAAVDAPNGGMHDSIFVKVWGDAGGGDTGRRALANYAYALGQCSAAGQVAVPEGFVLMPRRLTAENGAKGLLSGEFHESTDIECPECLGDGDDSYGDDCPECSGTGKVQQRITVEWDTIKRIYDMAVENLAAAPAAPAQAKPLPSTQPLIGKLLDQFSELPVLWGLNEPGALVRHGDVFKMLVDAGKAERAQASTADVRSQEGGNCEA